MGDKGHEVLGLAALKGAYKRAIGIGVAVSFCGFAVSIFGEPTPIVLALGSLFVGVGVFFAGIGVYGTVLGAKATALLRSLNLIGAGRLGEAEATLDEIQGGGQIAGGVHVQRAMIAAQRGDIGLAMREAEATLVAPASLFNPTTSALRMSTAWGIRAWARALSGDSAGALSDVEAVRKSAIVSPHALALASLAEALLLHRRGDRAALASNLRRDRFLLGMALPPRDRACVRALAASVRSSATTVYRTSATEGKREDLEKDVYEWLERIIPDLAPHLPRTRVKPAPANAAPALRASEAAKERARVHVRAKSSTPESRRFLGLWVLAFVLIGLFVLFGDILPRRASSAPAPSPSDPALLWLWPGPAFLFAGFGAIAIRMRRDQAGLALNQRLACAVMAGADVERELEALAKSPDPARAAQAEILLYRLADRRAELDVALACLDRARARIARAPQQAALAATVAPQLASARAYALAALGRADEAAAELERLPAEHTALDASRFAVHLVALCATGDIEGAAALVAVTPSDVWIGPRDELLRDILRAAALGEPDMPEIARLKEELRLDPEPRHWLEMATPKVVALLSPAKADTEATPVASHD